MGEMETLPIDEKLIKEPLYPAFPRLDKMVKFGKKLRQCVRIALSIWGITSSKKPPGPIYAQFGIADPCNHKCVMCGDHPPETHVSETTKSAFYNTPGIMSFDHYKGIVDDLHDRGTADIEMVGQGEPMLNKHIVDMVAYAKKKGMYVRIVTNGSRLFAKQAEAFVDLGLDRLQLSLNAGDPETYPKIHVTESPENFKKVIANIRYLTDYKRKVGREAPYTRISFVITSRNCAELDKMVEVVHEMGADEAIFNHTVVHEGSQDLKMSEQQYRDMMESIPAAKALAEKLGVNANLNTFAATPPSYMYEEIKGPQVVPCYVGWYFARVLGNGSVLPCCQCTKPLTEIENSDDFGKSWDSDHYNNFRDAARALPEQSEMLSGCECDHCVLRPRNISIHNLLHPFNKIKGGESEMLYHVSDIFKSRKDDKN